MPQGDPTEHDWWTREYWDEDDFSGEIRDRITFIMTAMVVVTAAVLICAFLRPVL